MTLGTNTRVGIVGLGTMGRIYLRRLRAHRVAAIMTIDPRPVSGAQFASLQSALASNIRVDVWIIATPTNTHVALALQLLTEFPDARIIVEKPVGRLDDVEHLAHRLATEFPDARVVVSDLYGQGRLAEALHSCVRELPGAVRSIAVEMTKSRRLDERSGRFICHDYGIYGYEWFHVIRLIESVAPRATLGAPLSGDSAPRLLAHGAWEWNADGLLIRACSRTDGEVGLRELDETRHGRVSRTPFRRLRVTTGEGTMDVNLDDPVRSLIMLESRAASMSRALVVDRADAVVEAVAALIATAEGSTADPLATDVHRLLTFLKDNDTLAHRTQGEVLA
jgi:hypothetical protein